jgi:kynurenine formamidase
VARRIVGPNPESDMNLIDLSHVLETGMAVYPGDPVVPRIDRLSEHGVETHQSSAFACGCHAGTHIDLPLHFLAGKPSLEALAPERFIGAARVLDAPEGAIPATLLDGIDPAGLDFVLFRTGWARHWGTPRYYDGWPYLTHAAARRLADMGLKGVGLDTPSIDPAHDQTAHALLAAADLINVENLANLEALPAGRFEFQALPLRLSGAEASPVRALARI